MSERRPFADLTSGLPDWGIDFEVVVCEHCQWRYLAPCKQPLHNCPHCCQAALEEVPGGLPDMPHPYPPELLVPFGLSSQQVSAAIDTFISDVPFPPRGLKAAALRKNLLAVYLPVWLVDSTVSAQWQAEIGFDYEVVSHQEYYNGDSNHWDSREVKEPRIRWESRLGSLQRGYQNVIVPALEDQASLEKRLGSFDLKQVLPYDPELAREAIIRLPDFPPKLAWDEATAAFQKAAANECQQACGANHIRQFHWKAAFNQPNWTFLLLPVYASSYQDDHGQRQPLLIHGQTGVTSGVRKASISRASRSSLLFFTAAVLFILLGLLVNMAAGANSTVSDLATVLVLCGFIGVLASSIPVIIAWDFNRKQSLERIRVKQAP